MKRDVSELILLAILAAAFGCSAAEIAAKQPVVPAIESFAAATTPVTVGHRATLSAVFSNGTGAIDHGVGAVTSGVAVPTGDLLADTTFTLIVTAPSGITATANVPVTVVAAPSIAAFTAGAGTVTAGKATRLTPVFSGGAGVIDHGIGAVTSGVAISTGALSATTTFTLTVTNAAGEAVTAQLPVAVTAAPYISSFSAGAATVTAGGSTTLTAVFGGGTARVDHGVGSVTSQASVPTGPLAASTTYTLTVTNGAGDAVTAQVPVAVVAAPAISSFSPAHSPVDSGTGTDLRATFSGGSGVITPGNLAIISGSSVPTGALTAGTTYTLTVTNAAGAAATAQATVSVTPPPTVITAFAAAASTVSSGTGTTLSATFSGGSGVITPGNLAIASGGSVPTGALTASTIYTLTVTGAGGTATAQATVAVVPAPAISGFAPARANVTSGASTTLGATFTGGTGIVTPGNLAIASGGTVSTGPLTADTTFTLTVTNAVGGSTTRTATVLVSSAPGITAFGAVKPTVTAGTSATLTATFSGGSGVITPGHLAISSGGSVATGPLSSTTVFTLTVTNAAGDVASTTLPVAVVPAAAIAAFGPDQSPVTAGGSTVLRATFSGGGGLITPGNLAIVSGGSASTGPLAASTTYTLTVTNGAGDAVTQQTTVSVVLPSTIDRFDVAANPVPYSGTTTLTAVFPTGTGSIDHGIGPVTSGVPVPTGPLTADTTYRLTVTNGAGVTAFADVVVAVEPAPHIAGFTATAPLVTVGDGTSLLATFSNGSGRLTPGDVPVTSGVPVPTGALLADTTYLLTVTNAAGYSTPSPASVTVTVVPAPTIGAFTASPTQVTVGEGATLTASYANGTGEVDHAIGAVTSGVGKPTGALGATTTYRLTVTNAAGTPATQDATVTVIPAPAIVSFAPAAGSIPYGTGTSLTATFSGGTGVITPGGIPVTSGTPVSTGALEATTTYTLTVTNSLGKQAALTTTVTVQPPLAPAIGNFAAAQSPVPYNGSTTLTASFSNGTGVIDHGIGAVTSGTPVTVGPLTTATTYTLTVTNPVGATATSTATVSVNPKPAIGSFAPDQAQVTSGGSTLLRAVFTEGTGVITPGNLGIASSGSVSTGALTADTTYTLTVTNGAGYAVTSQATVAVVAAPTIGAFTASPATVTAGGTSSLSATFSGGTGVITPGNLPITSGTPVSTGTLGTLGTTTYTLTVTNGAGGSATAQVPVTVVAPPAISGFSTSPATVTVGGAASLTATFSGGTGVITPGNITVTSGTPVSTGPLAAPGTSTFTLTVTNAAGTSATQQVPVTVVAAPAIGAFTASPSTLPAGASATLTPVFNGGSGVIDHGIGAVLSGATVPLGPVTATTTWTLTVTNAAGSVASATATVTVQAPAGSIAFTTEGATFAPVIVVTGSPSILWTFADGSTSASAKPSVNYGSAATRTATLQVTPWSAVTRINVGYDQGDTGPTDIEVVPDQHVSAVAGLENVKGSLVQWCSSYNRITSLDFSGFTALQDIEAFRSISLTTVNLQGTPALVRACLEESGLTGVLDVTGSPALGDLRAASSGSYTTVNFGGLTYPNLWHICVRDNPQFTTPALFADTTRFPFLKELLIWNSGQAGPLRVPTTGTPGPVTINAADNAYTSLDLRGALQNTADIGILDLARNQLTTALLAGCAQLTSVSLQGNPLSVATKDEILALLDGWGRRPSGGNDIYFKVDLTGLPLPSAAGMASAASLQAKGWTVLTGATPTPP